MDSPAGGEHNDDDRAAHDLSVWWGGKAFVCALEPGGTIGSVKRSLEQQTGVLVKRQKLVGLKTISGSKPSDETPLEDLKVSKKQRVMMVGAVEKDIAPPIELMQGQFNVVDDLDFDYWPENDELTRNQRNVQALQEQMRRCTSVSLIHPLREDKKLCVLDLDYTLFDTKAPTPTLGQRPFLEHFMRQLFQSYDICVWSQTSWRWIELKLTELGLLTHPDFRIAFVLDRSWMFKVTTRRKGEKLTHEVKALALIWKVLPQYGAHNTVHVDDLSRNFAMNPGSGIKIKAYKDFASSQHSDTELRVLGAYLHRIAPLDFSQLSFKSWKDDAAGWGIQ